jgi:hypothetical protein
LNDYANTLEKLDAFKRVETQEQAQPGACARQEELSNSRERPAATRCAAPNVGAETMALGDLTRGRAEHHRAERRPDQTAPRHHSAPPIARGGHCFEIDSPDHAHPDTHTPADVAARLSTERGKRNILKVERSSSASYPPARNPARESLRFIYVGPPSRAPMTRRPP